MTPIKNNNTHFATIYLINMNYIKYPTLFIVCVFQNNTSLNLTSKNQR